MAPSIERFHCIQDSQLGPMVPSIERFHCSTYTCCVCKILNVVQAGQNGCWPLRKLLTLPEAGLSTWISTTSPSIISVSSLWFIVHHQYATPFTLLPHSHTPHTSFLTHFTITHTLPTFTTRHSPTHFTIHSHTPHFHHILSDSRPPLPPPFYKLTSSLRSHRAIVSACKNGIKNTVEPLYKGHSESRTPL